MEARASHRIPFDGALKPLVLAAHFVGFGSIFGAGVADQPLRHGFVELVVVTGLLLVTRELIHEGLGWLGHTEGLLTAGKVALLGSAVAFQATNSVVLVIVVTMGALTSHLPKDLRERSWWRRPAGGA